MSWQVGAIAALLSCGLVVVGGCANRVETGSVLHEAQEAISPEEATKIAEEAYVYAYPMLENYRTLYVQAIDKTSPGYQGPFNEIHHNTQLLGPDFKDIVRPNNDTLYSFAWIDLRAEPLVITVPAVGDRYYSIQLVDMFTNNIGYIGTRATGVDAGSYLVVGPQWKGAKPGNVESVIESDSEFVYCIIRTEVRGPGDVETVAALQKQYHLTPFSVFLGRSRTPVSTGITFPRYDARKAQSAGFVDYLNFLLTQVRVPESDGTMIARFNRIDVEPGMLSASTRFSPEIRNSIDAGVGAALVKISKATADLGSLDGVVARSTKGWIGTIGAFGDPEAMEGRGMVRAAAAMLGLYGNDAEEAYYPISNADASGHAFNGATDRYVMRFEASELPAVNAFWSMTMYGLPDQLMVANPIDRYSIGDRSKLTWGEDGSLTIYIQHESPGSTKESNWLPAPAGPFSLQFRMYLPKSAALSPLYLPPDVERVP
ncbi:MAG: DUF1254 domain-containing protein [Polyangiales bacterium]